MNVRATAMTMLKPSIHAELYDMLYIVCSFCSHGTYDAEVKSEQEMWRMLLVCCPYHLMPFIALDEGYGKYQPKLI